jgi:hypothetical protein
LKNMKTLKVLFIFLSALMTASIWSGVLTETGMELMAAERITAGLFGTLVVFGVNYVVYKLLVKIWK